MYLNISHTYISTYIHKLANIYIYIYIVNKLDNLFYCLCGSVANASDTQAVEHGFEHRPDH